MSYIFIAILFVLFGLEYRRRKKFESDLYVYVAQRINPVKAELQNNSQASRNSYKKLVQDLEQTNSRISGQSLEIASLKRDMQLSGIFITEE